MDNVLIIPDIHGRNFWIEPCQQWQGSIIFLGDYHDPYPNQVSVEDSLENLRKLAKFVTNNKDRCRCLLGNHDQSYFTGNLKCRFDYKHEEEIRELLKSLKLQQYHISTIYPHKYIFTHAGVTQDWLNYHGLSDLVDIGSMSNFSEWLEEVPRSRGGNSLYGSLLWNSLEDYESENHIPDYYQIFGHTWSGRTEPVIKEDFAMLDCGKAFTLDLETKELKEWKKA